MLRVWDALFYEGSKILFRAGVTLIALHKPLILQARTFTDIVQVFKQITADRMALNCHDFMQVIIQGRDKGGFFFGGMGGGEGGGGWNGMHLGCT